MVYRSQDTYFLVQTGNAVYGKTSKNLTTWDPVAAALGKIPTWVSAEVSASVTDLWAPDISYFGGVFHLYYSASTFGSNKSCIGHATRTSLSSGQWLDHGSVICSKSTDDWNAIDPNVIVDSAGVPWLVFGSFWSGIKIVKLTNTGTRADSSGPTALASRPNNGGAVEAPFIVRRCGYYYLFVSFDACCKGVDSTYNIRVGRSSEVTGPYADQSGTPMLSGGGTLVLKGDERWKGPGHNAILLDGSKTYNVYHAYDASNNGSATLRISELVWDTNGWPVSGGP
jgi:arabinan endo-1,5-alpha-L-arabinosidase